MEKLKQYIFNNLIVLLCMGLLVACQEEEYMIPELEPGLHNDAIKRSLGPNVVGLDIEFAYAMALPREEGRIVSAQVDASIPGAEGTYLEHRSYHTNGSGEDVGVIVGEPSVTQGTSSRVNMVSDTNAVTLRYYYMIPEEARGKEVTFNFSANSSNGQTVNYTMGPYQIAKMDMVLDLELSDGEESYISIEDMAVYNASEATANADKIDLVYLFRSVPGVVFNHALVSPANQEYLPEVTLPAGVDRSTKIRKVWGLRDQHLARLQYGVYVDDLDFEELDLSESPNYAINMRSEAGAWVETEDGRFKAYIYINSVDNANAKAVISIKRYSF